MKTDYKIKTVKHDSITKCYVKIFHFEDFLKRVKTYEFRPLKTADNVIIKVKRGGKAV